MTAAELTFWSAVIVAVISTAGVLGGKWLDTRASKRTEQSKVELGETLGTQAQHATQVAREARAQATTAQGSADDALKRAEAAETAADTIQKNFEQFALRTQKDFEQIRSYRGQILSQETDINHLKGEVDTLKKMIAGQESVIETLTKQNTQQHERITELEAWRVEANAHMDEFYAWMESQPEAARPVLKTKRPNSNANGGNRKNGGGK